VSARLILCLTAAAALLAGGGYLGLQWLSGPERPKLPTFERSDRKREAEKPPSGLPIIAWGRRDHFPVIRQPAYVNAKEGDRLLAADEPVLGLVLGGQARAWSTNQLNDHEMVIDEVAGTPILATY
jgi:hypothetical protein